MKPYPAYKPTGLKWLPEVPQGWDVLHIRELFSERRVKVSDKDYPPLSVSRGGIVPQIETVAKSDDGDNRKLVKRGDFVINSRSDRKSSSGVSQLDGSVSLINIVLEPREQLAGAYAHYLLKCHDFAEEFYRNGRGIVGDLWTTRYSEMKSISLPIPTLEEQASISAYLDAKTAKFDRLIKLKEREIELLQEKKQAVISTVVTRGLDPNVKLVDSGVDWIGKVPRGWKKDKVSRCFNIIGSGTTPESSNTAYFLGGTIPWVNSGDVYAKGRYFYETEKKVTELALKKCAALKFFPRKSIVIAMYGGSIGNMSIADFEFCCNQACCCLAEARKDVLLDYVFLVLSCAKEYWLTLSSGGGQPNISQEKIRRTWVPLPPLEEQRKIVAYLDAETAKTDRTVAVVRRQIELLREYRTRLISDAVTGRIDLREAVA